MPTSFATLFLEGARRQKVIKEERAATEAHLETSDEKLLSDRTISLTVSLS